MVGEAGEDEWAYLMGLTADGLWARVNEHLCDGAGL